MKGLLDAADALADGALVRLHHLPVACPAGPQILRPGGGPLIGALGQAVGEEQLSVFVDIHAHRPLHLLQGLGRLIAGAEVLLQALRDGRQGVLRQLDAVGEHAPRLFIAQFRLL